MRFGDRLGFRTDLEEGRDWGGIVHGPDVLGLTNEKGPLMCYWGQARVGCCCCFRLLSEIVLRLRCSKYRSIYKRE